MQRRSKFGEKQDCRASSGQFPSYWRAECPEDISFDSVTSDLTYIEKKKCSHNSYSPTYKDNTESETQDSTLAHYSETSSACYNNSVISTENLNVTKPLSEKNPIVKEKLLNTTCKVHCPQSIHPDLFFTSNKTYEKNKSNTWAKHGYNSYSEKNENSFSMNKYNSNGHNNRYSSPSSNFLCSKCGFGYPCTLFLCKRNKLPCNESVTEKSQSFNNTVRKDFTNSISCSSEPENKNSKIIHSPEEFCVPKVNCSSSFEKYTDNLINNAFPLKPETIRISHSELTDDDKMQQSSELSEFSASNIECMKNVKNTSISKNCDNICNKKETPVTENNDVELDHLAMASPSKNFDIKADNENNFNKSNSIKAFDSLAEEAKNLLNELALASSGSNTFSEHNSGFDLAPVASHILNSKVSDDTFTENQSPDNCHQLPKSTNEVDNQCNIGDVSKDVNNALDLIEQSSLYDRNLSSAEICNSLNQIFSESSSTDLSTNVSNVEFPQMEVAPSCVESNSMPVYINNDSEICLQTEESNIDSSETYINISDLCLGGSNNVQSILLIQDASGNVETMYVIDDSLNKEGTESLIQNIATNGEGIVLTNNIRIEDVLQNQCTTDNESVFIDTTSDQVQSLVVTQNISAHSTNTVSFDSNNKDELSENALVKNNALTSQNNLDDEQSASDEIKALEIMVENKSRGELIQKKKENENELDVTSTQNMDYVESTSKDIFQEGKEVTEKIDQGIIGENMDYLNRILKKSMTNKDINIDLTLSDERTSSVVSGNTAINKNSNRTKVHENIIAVDTDFKVINISGSTLCQSQQNVKAKKSVLQSVLLNGNAKNIISENIRNFCSRKSMSQSHDQLLDDSKVCKIEVPVNGVVFGHKSETVYSDKVANSLSLLETSSSKFRLVQKSKKSAYCKLMKRSAKKSIVSFNTDKSDSNYYGNDLSQLHKVYSSDPVSLSMYKTLGSNQSYSEFKSLMLKRRNERNNVLNNQSSYKRSRKNEFYSVLNDDALNESDFVEPKSRFVALKTFKRPFTSAKKSLPDSREGIVKKFKNKALKTFVPKPSLIKTALKSARKPVNEEINRDIIADTQMLLKNVSNINQTSDLHYNAQLKIFIQPEEISEIRILPNDCLKKVSNILQNPSTYESSNMLELEDNISEEEEIKLSSGCTSPVEEFLPFKTFCTCSAKEVPCICSDYNLQMTCEGEDSIDERVVKCTNSVSKQFLLAPSSEVRYRAFCDMHLARLRLHHCCPKCGIFCSQGTFILCSPENVENVEDHLFHFNCFLIPAPGLPPACPHCCKFSDFKSVSLMYSSCGDQENKEVPLNSKNITSESDGCDIFMTVNPISKQAVMSSVLFLPEQNDVKTMITALAKEKILRLRPTGKCLYNPIKTGDVQKVMQLLANGVNPNHKFRMHNNNAPVHVAAYYGWIGILHILIQAGAQIDAVNDDLETPLIVAVERNQLPIIRYLVFAGAQIDVKDCNGMTSFHIASKNGYKDIAEFLYSSGLVDINLQDEGGWTALVWACEHKHEEFVKWLLEIGSDPNLRDNEENTVLHWAAYSGKSEITALLLEKNCILSYVNKRGDTPLHIAARENNFESVKLLVCRGAVLDLRNKENKTPLMCCEDGSLCWKFLYQCISSGSPKMGKMQLEKHLFRDISRGAEAYPIQAVNDVDDEEFIMEFKYIIKNCYRSGIDVISTVNQMMFCSCKNNCLTRECRCFLNSKCWYDENGCLTAEFESTRPEIFECNKTCHCPKTCFNRVVQRGLRCPLQLFRTKYQGWGVRTLQDLPKGAFVCEYVGEVITGTEAMQRDDDSYFFDLESKDFDYCLDGRYYGNVARFINHSCEPNLMAVKVFVDHQDLNFPRIALFTHRNIQAFEELCFDYGLDFWIVKSRYILCTCGAQSCKYSKDTIDETFDKFYMDTTS